MFYFLLFADLHFIILAIQYFNKKNLFKSDYAESW